MNDAAAAPSPVHAIGDLSPAGALDPGPLGLDLLSQELARLG